MPFAFSPISICPLIVFDPNPPLLGRSQMTRKQLSCSTTARMGCLLLSSQTTSKELIALAARHLSALTAFACGRIDHQPVCLLLRAGGDRHGLHEPVRLPRPVSAVDRCEGHRQGRQPLVAHFWAMHPAQIVALPSALILFPGLGVRARGPSTVVTLASALLILYLRTTSDMPRLQSELGLAVILRDAAVANEKRMLF